MKWQPVSLSLMAIALPATRILLLQRQLFFIPELFTPAYTGADLQLGYYDLLSKKRELYYTQFDTRGKVVVVTLNSPNDNRFKIKTHLEQQKPILCACS